jgi:hypothetical protein
MNLVDSQELLMEILIGLDIVIYLKDIFMKLFQYQDDSELDENWKFIYIIERRGIYTEMNPNRERIVDFDYESDEFVDAEECLYYSYNATRLI